MTIQIGDRLPEGTLRNSSRSKPTAARSARTRSRWPTCAKGKKIAIFGLPGAFTPTCSAKHVPGYVQTSTS